MSETFITDFTGRRATVILNRPERRNALRQADLAPLTAALEAAAARPEIRVLVLTGAGDKAFCAGADLDEVARGAFKQAALDRLAQTLEDLPLPTICAFNGGIFGGGLDLAMACDFRVGIRGMRCAVPPAKLGIHYSLAGMTRAVHRLGLGAAKRLFLAAETFDDETLFKLQFVDYLVAREALGETVDRLADDIAALAPLAVRAMKQTLNAIARDEADPAAVQAEIERCWRSADFREALKARAEGRAPVFEAR